jgi:hypothetical protein
MLYIKNNRKYAVAFTVTRDNKPKRYSFDCMRVYSDTGNIATTGVTEIAESDLEWLKKNCLQCKAMLDSGDLALTSAPVKDVVDTAKVEKVEKENKVLKAKADKAESENKALADENADLKKQLEALKKSKKSKADSESEGF